MSDDLEALMWAGDDLHIHTDCAHVGLYIEVGEAAKAANK